MDAAHEAVGGARLRRLLASIDTLPTLAPIAAKVMHLGADEQADIQDVVRVVQADPALAARLLAMCRAASAGLGGQVTSVRRAVVMLGLDAVRSALLSVCFYEVFPPAEPGSRGGTIDRRGLWRHSIGVACAAELLAEVHPQERIHPGEAYIAGLLHDLGRIALDALLPRLSARVAQAAAERRCAAAVIERAILGIDHHDVGKRLAERWGLPDAVRDVVWLCGRPARALPAQGASRLVGVVSVAKAACLELRLGWCADGAPTVPARDAAREYALDPARVDDIALRLHDAVAARARALGLEDRTGPQMMLQSIAEANRALGRLGGALSARERAGREEARAVAALEALFAHLPDAPDLDAALRAVAESARAWVGSGHAACLHRLGDGSAWRLVVAGRGGQGRGFDIEPGSPAHASLESLRARGGESWEGPAIAEALRAVPECPDLGSTPRANRLSRDAPVLLCAGPAGEPAHPILLAAWSRAVRSAIALDRSRALTEGLAATTRAAYEEQSTLVETQAVERLRLLAAGAAHEMNNPLTVILGRAQMLRERLHEPRDRAWADEIGASAERLAELVTDLHDLAKPAVSVPQVIDLAEVARLAAGDLAERRPGSGPVRVRVEGGESTAVADREALRGALLEVLLNAADASPGSSIDVLIGTAHTHAALRRRWVQVFDRGQGVSDLAARHAFDPFFSDRPAGRGRGMGLARVRRVVEDAGGEVSLRTAEGGGGVCSILLPAPGAEGARSAA